MTSQDLPQKISYRLVFILLLFIFGIVGIGYFYYDYQKQHVRENEESAILAIADSKVDQIVEWRRELQAEADAIFDNRMLTRNVQHLLISPTAREDVLDFMNGMWQHYDYKYKAIFLIDNKDSLLLKAGDPKREPGNHIKEDAAKVRHSRSLLFTELEIDQPSSDIHLDILIPLQIIQGIDTLPIGILVLQIDPEFINKISEKWPPPNQTGETMILRREGDEVIFLNDLKRQKHVPLFLHRPLSEEHLPAAMAALGHTGIVEGLDYDEVPVLAALKGIPNTPWFVVAKIDLAEMYAPLRERTYITLILAGLLIVATGSNIGFIWRHQQVRFYRRQFEDELERKALVQHFDYIVKYAHDIILLLDSDTRIVEANERALTTYGYSDAEMRMLTLRDIRAPHTLSEVPTQLLAAREGTIFETVHRRKDGTEFSVEVSAHMIQIEGREYYQSIIRDITERKKAEARIKEQSSTIQSIMEGTDNPIFAVDTNYCYIGFNRSHAAVMKSLFNADIKIGQNLLNYHTNETYRLKAKANIDRALCGERVLEETVIGEQVESQIYLDISHNPIMDAEGKVTGVAVYVNDVTEHKRAEQAIRSASAYNRRLIEASIDPLVTIGPDGTITDVNSSTVAVTGHSREELVGTDFSDYFTEPEKARAGYLQVYSDGSVRDYPLDIRHKDGHITSVLYNGSVYRNEEGDIIGVFAAARDITDQKLAEKKIQSALEEKETLLREIHHRVKNNLQAIIALINMHSKSVHDAGGKQFLKELEGQARTMSLVYEQLYQSKNLANVAMDPYIQQLTSGARESFGIKRIIDIKIDAQISLDVTKAMPCGLIVNELFTNILKHAFPSTFQGEPAVQITMKEQEETCCLTVSDNGVGFPAGINQKSRQTLGLHLVELWATHQLGGKLDIRHESGTTFSILFETKE